MEKVAISSLTSFRNLITQIIRLWHFAVNVKLFYFGLKKSRIIINFKVEKY